MNKTLPFLQKKGLLNKSLFYWQKEKVVQKEPNYASKALNLTAIFAISDLSRTKLKYRLVEFSKVQFRTIMDH